MSKFQNAFVEELQILDASLIVNEAIDSLLKDGSSDVVSFVSWILKKPMTMLIGLS